MPPMCRRIEEPADAHRAVDQESSELDPSPMYFCLEDIVQQTRHEPDVMEKIADSDLHRIGQDEVIGLRDGLQGVLVHLPIELKHQGIERFPGIVVFLCRYPISDGKGVVELIPTRSCTRHGLDSVTLRRRDRS